MINRYLPTDALHDAIRRVWLRSIAPSYASRDRSRMLAALVLATTCFDELLSSEGYAGMTSVERLLSARRSLSNYTGVCGARRLRNAAVHHLDFCLTAPACGEALDALAEAIGEHGVDLSGVLHQDVDARARAVLPSPHEQRRQRRGYRGHVDRRDATEYVPPACGAL